MKQWQVFRKFKINVSAGVIFYKGYYQDLGSIAKLESYATNTNLLMHIFPSTFVLHS